MPWWTVVHILHHSTHKHKMHYNLLNCNCHVHKNDLFVKRLFFQKSISDFSVAGGDEKSIDTEGTQQALVCAVHADC